MVSYGADPNGLVHEYRFGPDGCGRPIGADEAVEWLGSQRDDGLVQPFRLTPPTGQRQHRPAVGETSP
jgi:hypothetical protein